MPPLRRPLSPRAGAVLAACAAMAIAIAGCTTSRVAPSALQLATASGTPSASTDGSTHSEPEAADQTAPATGRDRGTTGPRSTPLPAAGAGGATGSLAAVRGSLAARTGTTPAAESDEALAAGIRPFPEAPRADYQVGGAYDPAPGVTLVVRDSSDSPAPGVYNVCSVNAFHSRPADIDFWLSNNRDLVLWDATGAPLADEDRPGEYILDISTSAKRARIAEIQTRTLRDCAARGFQAVVLDNLDSYKHSRGALDLGAASAFAALLTAKAHALGLPVGQKNTPELGWAGSDEIGFDFAVAEGCVSDGTCSAYTDVYGKRVVGIEYTDRVVDQAALCADPRRPASTILRDRDLRLPGTPGYTFSECTP